MNLPQEFLEKMKGLLGSEYDKFIESYNDERYYGLRVNTLKVPVEEFLEIVPFKLEPVPWTSEGFYYNGGERPAKHPYYHAGLYYIQEPSAMAPGEMIGVEPGDKVLDLCAAPGGKSTQVAAKLAGEGLLVTNDISTSRVKALVKNIELYGVKNAVVTNETPEKLAQKFPNFFDKILVDAPCSGEGMFRKDEQAAKSWGIHSVEKCSVMQRDILDTASRMLKPGGSILYSTCTFSPEENEHIIDRFLKNNSNFEILEIPKHSGIQPGRDDISDEFRLDRSVRFWPHKVKGEGHFLALLHKKDGEEVSVVSEGKVIDKKILKDFESFCNDYLNIKIDGKFELYGEYLHLLPQDIPSLNGLKVIRPGWFLGMLKKGRFEPSHAMALALKPQHVKNNVDFKLDSKEVIKYLKGDTLDVEAKKGWNLVSVNGFSLGWAKGAGDILKNYYPSGWRWVD